MVDTTSRQYERSTFNQKARILIFVLLCLYMYSRNFYVHKLQQYSLSVSDAYYNAITSHFEDHLVWFQEQRKAALNLTAEEEPLKLHYRAMAGLGHQFNRMAAVYHLSKIYKIPRIYVTSNPVCGGDLFTIYDHLIGQGPLMVDLPFSALGEVKIPYTFPNLTMADTSTMSKESLASLKRCPNINNNVPSYIQPPKSMKSSTPYIQELVKDFHGKESTDYEFYQQIMLLFKDKHQDRIQEVLSGTKFTEHTVFALHVRTGNGEKGDFLSKKRNIEDLDKWVQNVMTLFCSYSETFQEDYFTEKPFMIFVGTDSSMVVTKLQDASSATCKVPVVSTAQEYPEEGSGVSFAKKYDDQEKCLKGWENMLLDMYLFTLCNTVIAGQYSSFTQGAPLSYIFQKSKKNPGLSGAHPHYYCELGKEGDALECFDNLKKWMLRERRSFFGNLKFERQNRFVEIQFPWIREMQVLKEIFAGTALRPRNLHRMIR